MARLRASWRTSLPVVQQPRNPQSESIARTPYDTDFSIRFESRRDEVGEVARALAVFRRNTIELLDSRKRLSNQAEILARSLDLERTLATEQRNFITPMPPGS